MNGFSSNFADRASNSMRVSAWQTSMVYQGMQSGRRIYLDNTDLLLTSTQFAGHVGKTGATIYSWDRTISNGPEYIVSGLIGVYPSYTEIEPYKVTAGNGRFINEQDIRDRRKVIVIHPKTAETLFKRQDAIGRMVNVDGIAYKVIGIYTRNRDRNDQDAFIPFTTAQIIYNKGNRLHNISFTTNGLDTREKNEAFEKEYKAVLARHHQFDPADDSAVWIWNRFTQYLEMLEAKSILSIAIWVIGIFTLLSGIVGVSNIMLITVKERTKEFGIRKALGASPASILWLIILESVMITTLFGYIGMVAGIGVTEWAAAYFDAQAAAKATEEMTFTIFKDPTVSIGIALQAILVLIIAGTLAGFFPARKAVQIKPIEALRAD